MLAGIGVLAYNRGVFIDVLFLYLIASTITFLMYAFDKSAAMKQTWRTAENTLHVLSMVGGWPGALAGQRLLRHKSRKTSFQVVFWLTVILNLVIVAWLTTPSGAGALKTFISLS